MMEIINELQHYQISCVNYLKLKAILDEDPQLNGGVLLGGPRLLGCLMISHLSRGETYHYL